MRRVLYLFPARQNEIPLSGIAEVNELVLIANQKAQESEEMKTAFIRNMSHEIRTPLNAINGFSELITNDDISMDEKQAFSRIIYENCYHLTSMLNNLLEIASLIAAMIPFLLFPHVSMSFVYMRCNR